MKTIQYQATCPNCGAPITTEICPYCNSATGIDTASANMDYPLLECKPATIDFWSVGFPTVFAVFCTEGKREKNHCDCLWLYG